ncbi:hypothetical protein WKI13_16750 [Teredinibacter turnerae]|uniref:hypothetical protein n=1 Tax=Teredinibacter turnerae TaxID=2426 RepID=UPI000372E204|nr:hypothetical protein [Teredinibacter turnerae]
MSRAQTPLQKYLAQYAEAESSELNELPDLAWQRVVVIPAFRESDQFLRRFKHTFGTPAAPTTILILVVNRPDTSSHCPENHQLIEACIQHFGPPLWQNNNLSMMSEGPLTLLLVDRETLPIPMKQGVGLARKIGCDLAAALFEKRRLNTPWIHSTDADTHLPENYFSPPDHSINCGAQVFNFRHLGNHADPDCAEATHIYEQHLNYYRDGLSWAGSPYNFSTLGSSLAIHAETYAQVRGFPRKAGGEDFYLLNKAAKLQPIAERQEITLQISARHSDRVPFGTGPAVAKILDQQAKGRAFVTYDPRVFIYLKNWLAYAPSLWTILQGFPKFPLDAANLNACRAAIPDALYPAISTLNVDAFLQHAAKQCHTDNSFRQHFHSWFDAFATLKFIHTLQSSDFPPISLDQALRDFAEVTRA